MQKFLEVSDRKRGEVWAKKKNCPGKRKNLALSAVTSEVTTPKSFLLVVEGAMHPSLDNALANLSTSSSHLFSTNPRLKTSNNENITYLIKVHISRFVWIDMEANACSSTF